MKRIAVFIILTIFLIQVAYAIEIRNLKAEIFEIPNYNSNVPSNDFNGIGIDGSSGNVSLANDYGWCEIPYRGGQFNFRGSFIAPTKGYKLKAVSSAPAEVYVFDALSNSIMGGRGNYKLSIRLGNPTGMTYHKGKVYIADSNTDKIYEVELTGGEARVLRSFNTHYGICGLASDGGNLYSCDKDKIYKYDSDMKVVAIYKLNVSINGICATGRGEILAVAKNKGEIYRLRF